MKSKFDATIILVPLVIGAVIGAFYGFRIWAWPAAGYYTSVKAGCYCAAIGAILGGLIAFVFRR